VPDAKTRLLILLGLFVVMFITAWGMELKRRNKWRVPPGFHFLVGFITNFFDTLGIGSFATTTSLYRPRRTVPDEMIPGTLNVGHTIPTFVEAFIYMTVIVVETRTLVLMIAASVLGAWLGAGVVTRLPRRRIQIGMGVALLAAASLILVKLLYGDPKGDALQLNVLAVQSVTSQALPGLANGITQFASLQRLQDVYSSGLGLQGWLLVTALVGSFGLGALMTIGIGAYAPIMIMVSLLGMNPITAFPIMMGACAFLMPVASLRFLRTERYDARAALGLTLGGVPAVFLAAFIVWSLPLDAVRWLVVVVVVYTAVSMLLSARRERLRSTPQG
jgi:uncharacterized membrane protein YfcA